MTTPARVLPANPKASYLSCKDAVQAALGPLAQIDVAYADVRPQDAWLAPNSLDAHSETGPAKRHFVDVSFADGRYVVR